MSLPAVPPTNLILRLEGLYCEMHGEPPASLNCHTVPAFPKSSWNGARKVTSRILYLNLPCLERFLSLEIFATRPVPQYP